MNALLLLAVATVGIDYRFAACSTAGPADLQIVAEADGLIGEMVSLEDSHQAATPGAMPNMLTAGNRGLAGVVRQVQCQDGSCGLTGSVPQTQVLPVQQTAPQLAQPLPQIPPTVLSPFTVQQARLASPVVQNQQPQQQRGLCGR